MQTKSRVASDFTRRFFSSFPSFFFISSPLRSVASFTSLRLPLFLALHRLIFLLCVCKKKHTARLCLPSLLRVPSRLLIFFFILFRGSFFYFCVFFSLLWFLISSIAVHCKLFILTAVKWFLQDFFLLTFIYLSFFFLLFFLITFITRAYCQSQKSLGRVSIVSFIYVSRALILFLLSLRYLPRLTL